MIWTATQEIRWFRRMGPAGRETVLQQKWLGQPGTNNPNEFSERPLNPEWPRFEWRDVPTVREGEKEGRRDGTLRIDLDEEHKDGGTGQI